MGTESESMRRDRSQGRRGGPGSVRYCLAMSLPCRVSSESSENNWAIALTCRERGVESSLGMLFDMVCRTPGMSTTLGGYKQRKHAIIHVIGDVAGTSSNGILCFWEDMASMVHE